MEEQTPENRKYCKRCGKKLQRSVAPSESNFDEWTGKPFQYLVLKCSERSNTFEGTRHTYFSAYLPPEEEQVGFDTDG